MLDGFDIIRKIQRKHIKRLMALDNVVSCGLGYKVTDGQMTSTLAIVVGVTQKARLTQLTPSQMIPSSLEGVRTDVVEAHTIYAQNPKERVRPAPPGVSIGHVDVTAGTFGCVVRKDNKSFILSNNHVLANSNKAIRGDWILQPGSADGGTANDRIAALDAFVPINFVDAPTCPIGGSLVRGLNIIALALGSHHRVRLIRQAENQVDAAIAFPLPTDITPEILQIGVPTGVGVASLDMPVRKSGRTTGLTTGFITQVDVTVSVNYGGPVATFTNQLMTGAMSQGGDSGSLVVDEDTRAIGLLFAGSDTVTILNPIQLVLDALGVELVVEDV